MTYQAVKTVVYENAPSPRWARVVRRTLEWVLAKLPRDRPGRLFSESTPSAVKSGDKLWLGYVPPTDVD